MIKADRKGKASGIENLRPYHRMESMRKSNILSCKHLFICVALLCIYIIVVVLLFIYMWDVNSFYFHMSNIWYFCPAH